MDKNLNSSSDLKDSSVYLSGPRFTWLSARCFCTLPELFTHCNASCVEFVNMRAIPRYYQKFKWMAEIRKYFVENYGISSKKILEFAWSSSWKSGRFFSENTGRCTIIIDVFKSNSIPGACYQDIWVFPICNSKLDTCDEIYFYKNKKYRIQLHNLLIIS